ncbi:hypothetical protein HG530_000939 [Fusarium avenaceum]|nr:hypothetical protein HG530_000939 [Fusarium avenaceum]
MHSSALLVGDSLKRRLDVENLSRIHYLTTWNSGGGQHRISEGPSRMRSPMNRLVFTRTVASKHHNPGGRLFVVKLLKQLCLVHPSDPWCGKEDFAVRKLQAVHRLSWGVCVVEDDKYSADFGNGEEDSCVLFTVASHNGDAITNSNAHIQQ